MATSLVSTGVQFPDSTIQTTAASAGGKAANVQTFNSSGTWTKPSGYGANSRVLIQCWGGGGAGGSVLGSQYGGGGGGAYNYVWVTLSSMGSTETASVGAGGTDGGGTGGAGGSTSLGSFITAYGGGGGGAGSSYPYTTHGGSGGGQLSAGSSGSASSAPPNPAQPYIMGWVVDSSNGIYLNVAFNQVSTQYVMHGATGGIAGFSYTRYATVCHSFMHGGGGGSYVTVPCVTSVRSKGANSVWGGGGGGMYGGGGATTGGTSSFGGAGGAGSSGTGGAGTAPGGGGGGGYTAGAGAAGRIIVTVFDGS